MLAASAASAMPQSILDIPPAAPATRIAYGPDPNQFGELRRPQGGELNPLVIFIHGGYWRAGAKHISQISGLNLNRVVVAGHSAGGHLALWLAAQRAIDLKGVTALPAITDLRLGYQRDLGSGAVSALMACNPKQCDDRYSAASPMDLLPISVPQTLLHGTADDIVPFELSQRFAKASKNSQLIPLPGAGHFELIDPRLKEWPTVLKHICQPIANGG